MSQKLASLLAETRGRVRARDTGDWEVKRQAVIDSCHPAQRNFVVDTGRRLAALVARGGGKTTAERARLLNRMMRTAKARCLYIATTRIQAEELMWGPLKDLIEKLGIEATFNETKLRCTLKRNGATLRLVGADDKREIDKLRGQPFHEVCVDEAASYPTQLLEHLIFRIIGPRLGDYGGSLCLVGTPGHILSGPFYEATRPGSEIHRAWADREKPEYADWARWSFHAWSLQDGAPYVPAMARLWAEALLEKEANGWSDQHPVWLREYLGRWCADDSEHVLRYRAFLDDGTPWNQWDPVKDARTGLARLPDTHSDWRFVYGMDLGYSDPFALCVLAWSPTDISKSLYHVFEWSQKGLYSKAIAQILIGEELNAAEPGGLIGATGWPDAIVCDTATSGDAFIDEMANVYGITIVSAQKRSKFDHVELTNGDLVDGRIKVMKDSHLEKQALDLQWAVDEFGRLKENKSQRNDQVDAFIYARGVAMHLFAEEQPKPKIPSGHDPIEEFFGEKAEGEFTDYLADTYEQDFWGN